MNRRKLGERVVKGAAILLLGLSLAACGDDASKVGDETENQVTNQDSGGDECAEDEAMNPVTGDCIPAEPEDEEPTEPGDGEPERNDEDLECEPGGLIGQTCRPDGGPIPGATVTIEGIDCDGTPFEEEMSADSEGNYEFEEIPAGNHTITIASGSFGATEDVTIMEGMVMDREHVGQKACLVGDEVDIAVVYGSMDDIAGLLDGMEVEYDMYPTSERGDLLGDLDTLQSYEVVIAECGALLDASKFSDAHLEYNMRRFIQEGGSLYASDWAHGFIQQAMPEAMLFADEVDPTFNLRRGPGGDHPVDPVSDEMIDLMGPEQMEFHFTDMFTIVHSTNDPGGQVHFEAHYTPGYDGHQGDTTPAMITYDDPLNSGFVIFTEFHNSEQATAEVERILEYMIFQL